MGRYAIEPDNATKAAKARGSNLRVHFKVSFKYAKSQYNAIRSSVRFLNVLPDVDGFFFEIHLRPKIWIINEGDYW